MTALAQLNIVDAIDHFPEEERFAGLFKQAANIKKNIDWHWETFTHKKIEAYFGVVKDYENYLSQVVQGFSADVAAIQKTLSDTLIAAIAVVIGSFIASLFKDTFNPYIFRAGLTIYAIYILAIPLVYNMCLQWKKYLSFKDQRDARKTRLSESLPLKKIEEIWDSWKMDAVSINFEQVFKWTRGIYISVILLMLLAAWAVPPQVLANAVQSANATATPTVTSTVTPTLASTVTPAITLTAVPVNTPTP